MSQTIDRQLEHLAELHADGTLTDDEFASAKATALRAPTSELAPDPVLAAPRPSVPPKLVPLLMFFAALMIGITIVGLSTGLEWAPAQAPAAPIVCPGGRLVAAFDVAYTVNAKGVDLASVCVKDGTTSAVSGLWLGTVMVLEYTAVAFLLLYALRLAGLRRGRNRRTHATTWSSCATATGPGGDEDA
jgi:hypothetical protein